MSAHRYFVVAKPYQMLSQFVAQVDPRARLSDLDFEFPEGIHAIGRLDYLSEGLLILTNNKRVTRLLLHESPGHRRVYYVKVMRPITPEQLHVLRTGVEIQIEGGETWTTTPCEVDVIEKPEWLFPRPDEKQEYRPHTWLKFTLTEGKFRQVRKMVRSTGQRCIRLVRVSIEGLELGDLKPGEVREYGEDEFFRLLGIEDPHRDFPKRHWREKEGADGESEE